MNLHASWDANPDVALRLWRIYLSTSEGAKGELVAEASPETRSYVFTGLTEGEYWVRILAVNAAGTEEDWRLSGGGAAHHLLTRQSETTRPSALTSAGAGVVEASSQAALVVDPPASTDPAQRIELIRGPDAARGQLVGTVEVERSGYTGDMGERTPVLVPAPILPGRRSGGGDQTLVVRAVSADGKNPGTATTRTVPFLDMPNHYPVVIASISGASYTGITAPTSADAWELDASDGARLREVPATSAADADWTALLEGHETGAHYLTSATIATDECDLGAVYDFTLECYDEAQRKTAAGYVSTMPGRHARWPSFPAAASEIVGTATSGVMWTSRLLKTDGTPIRPLPPTKWEAKWGDASPITMNYVPYLPGMRLRARYVQARATLAEPMGHHQVICPRLYVRAWIPMATRVTAKSGANFSTAELDDVTVDGGPKVVGVRYDAGNRGIQVNIGGAIFVAALTAAT